MALEDTLRQIIREELATRPAPAKLEIPANPFYSLEQLHAFCPDVSVETWQYVARNHPSYFTWIGRVAVISAKNLDRLMDDFSGDRISTSRNHPRRVYRAKREATAPR